MTVRWGDTGLVSIGPLKTFIPTLPAPQEYTTAGVALPNTVPSSPQLTFNITSADFPTYNGLPYTSVNAKYVYYVHVGGNNTSGASASINLTMYKNGTQVLTGNVGSVANGQLWTAFASQVTISAGDTITISVWTNQASGVNYTYYSLQLIPTQIFVPTKAFVFTDCKLDMLISPALTAGTPTNASTSFWDMYVTDNTLGGGSNPNWAVGGNYSPYRPNNGIFSQHPTYGLGRIIHGDESSDLRINTHATICPYYWNSNFPKLTYREVFL